MKAPMSEEPKPAAPEGGASTSPEATQSLGNTLLKVVALLACIFLFIVGIKAMSNAFEGFGEGFANNLMTATRNPFLALIIGTVVTALVQSSSTTTSLIVGMVASGTIGMEAAIPMVMGANIGTTVTNTLVSMGHMTVSEDYRRALAAATVHDFFNLFAVIILLPLELAFGVLGHLATWSQEAFSSLQPGDKLPNPLKEAVKPVVHLLENITGEHHWLLLLISVAIIVGMLICIVKVLKSLVLKRIETFFDTHLFKSWWRAMAFGLLLTVAVQSSSITTSLIVPLAGAGVLRLIQIFPYTMGANVGTTMTAMIAALALGEAEGVKIAFAHFFFNVVAILVIWPFPVMRQVPLKCAEWLADQSVKRWYVPIVFVALVFFVIPIVLILLHRWFSGSWS